MFIGIWTRGKKEYSGKYEWIWHKQRWYVQLDNGKYGIARSGDTPDFGQYKFKEKVNEQKAKIDDAGRT